MKRSITAIVLACLITSTNLPAAQATYSGATGRIAFGLRQADGNVDIIATRPNGNGRLQLTSHPGFDACPAYSRDGKRIAFCSNRSGEFEIRAMNANGTGQHPITNMNGFAVFPDWSPDGTRIAFSGHLPGEDDEREDVFIVRADGTGLTRLTHTPFSSLPVWSPDGSQILYLSGTSPEDAQLWVMNVNGAGARQLTFDPTIKDQTPDWSPDGAHIAYIADGDLWTMNADGTGQHPVARTDTFEFGTTWSPDGTRIAFLRESPGGRYVHTVRADGTDERVVLETPGENQLVPAWQPLGRR